MAQQAIQVVLTTIYVLFGSPIAGAITPAGWYWLGAGLAGLQFLLAFFLLPETKYDRDHAAYQEDSVSEKLGKSDLEANTKLKSTSKVCKVKPHLDYVHYEARTWKSDMRLWIGEPEWHKVADVLKVSSLHTCLPHELHNLIYRLHD